MLLGLALRAMATTTRLESMTKVRTGYVLALPKLPTRGKTQGFFWGQSSLGHMSSQFLPIFQVLIGVQILGLVAWN